MLSIPIAYSKSLERQMVGWLGEKAIARQLLRELDKGEYRVLNNLLFPSGEGGNTELTQLDHVVVSTHGIFCIETKTYKGWIFGTASDKHWTQVIYRYKHPFYNPLWQNYAHTEAIKRVLGPEKVRVPVVSLVVFPYAGKIEMTGSQNVGTIPYVVDKIRRSQGSIYTLSERDEIYARLIRMNITSRKWRNQHIRSVRAIQRQADGLKYW